MHRHLVGLLVACRSSRLQRGIIANPRARARAPSLSEGIVASAVGSAHNVVES